ncbi:hypothetical protein HNR40_002386 [Nonomuraea endophytica]|uniref:Uncharacterized protein n=1 Tax=Nonomuraea endophytica TaxID=714136 RepID=A0A7W7ZZW4_9ACTN|nr:hypothetical protein [Nonomuraea endophytica]
MHPRDTREARLVVQGAGSGMPVSPAVKIVAFRGLQEAAACRMLATLPGVIVIDNVSDQAGLVGVTLQLPTSGGRIQLVIDRQSGDLLAVQHVGAHTGTEARRAVVGLDHQAGRLGRHPPGAAARLQGHLLRTRSETVAKDSSAGLKRGRS